MHFQTFRFWIHARVLRQGSKRHPTDRQTDIQDSELLNFDRTLSSVDNTVNKSTQALQSSFTALDAKLNTLSSSVASSAGSIGNMSNMLVIGGVAMGGLLLMVK